MALRDCGHDQEGAIGALGFREPGLQRAEPHNATFGPVPDSALI